MVQGRSTQSSSRCSGLGPVGCQGSTLALQEAKAIHAMLEAYFRTAATRFIDSCVQDIDRALLQRSAPLNESVLAHVTGMAGERHAPRFPLMGETDTGRF